MEEVNSQNKTRVVTGLAGHVRKGIHGRGKKVPDGTVHVELVGVNADIALDKGRQPLH